MSMMSSSSSSRCMGVTKQGLPCSRKVKAPHYLCHDHRAPSTNGNGSTTESMGITHSGVWGSQMVNDGSRKPRWCMDIHCTFQIDEDGDVIMS